MKFLAAILLLSAPATAQKMDEPDKIITDANRTENAMQGVMADAKRLEADTAAGQLVVPPLALTPLLVTSPEVVAPGFIPDPMASPSLAGLEPIPSNLDRATELTTAPIPSSAAPDVVGAFRFICEPSHLNYDDPIVYPGVVGGSPHLHQWLGNTLGNAKSTYKSLRTTGNSTCMGKLNRSAYWQPALIDQDNKVVQPDAFSIYYKRRPASDPIVSDTTHPKYQGKAVKLPTGLRYIFGYDMKRMGQRQTFVHDWRCQAPNGLLRSEKQRTIDTLGCVAGDTLILNIASPDCWDGKNLDSADHRSHMAYTAFGGWGYPKCPATHPYVVPQFSIGALFKVMSGDDVSKWYVSSDRMAGMPQMTAGETFHADFFMAWDPIAHDTWEANCIDKMLNCSDGVLGNGQKMKQTPGFSIVARPRLTIPTRP